MGVASHGIGTAQALQVNETAGAFSGLAMGLNALATSVLLPALWRALLQKETRYLKMPIHKSATSFTPSGPAARPVAN